MSVHFNSDNLVYDFGILGKVYGYLSANVGHMTFEVITRPEYFTTIDEEGSRILPVPWIDSAAVAIDESQLDIQIWGDPLLTTVSSILPLFKGLIRD